MGGYLMSPETLTLLKMGVAFSTAAGIPTLGFIWAWARKSQSFDQVNETVTKMTEKLDLIEKEVYPALRNGGVVTKEQLERRIGFAEESIRGEIKLLAKSIENTHKQAKIDHGFAEEQLIRIVKKALE
jgi:hypothetical protein